MGVLLNPALSCPVAAFLQSSKSSAKHLVTLPEFSWKSLQACYCCPNCRKRCVWFSSGCPHSQKSPFVFRKPTSLCLHSGMELLQQTVTPAGSTGTAAALLKLLHPALPLPYTSANPCKASISFIPLSSCKCLFLFSWFALQLSHKCTGIFLQWQ